MSDEPEKNDKKKKSIRDFAADLTAAMKKNSDIIKPEDLNKEEEDHSVPPEREQLLRVLESDVDALGWDQPAKLYGVLESDDGEEYLKLITTLKNHAPADIMKMAKKGRAKENVKGVVVAVEAWGYPPAMVDRLKKNPSVLKAYYRILPPSDHPERVENRSVTMFNRDGSFACVTRSRGQEAELEDSVDPSLIPAVAALLGMENQHNHKHLDAEEMVRGIDQMAEVLKFIVRATDGMHRAMTEDGVSQEQYLRGIFEKLSPEARKELLVGMPRELKKMLGLD